MRPWRLWLKRHSVIPVSITALVIALVISTLARVVESYPGEEIEIVPLWISAPVALSLVFLFSPESPAEIIAPRSVRRSRIALLAVALAVIVVVSLVSFPGHINGYGGWAAARNMIGLIGLGLLARSAFPPMVAWMAPALASVASLMFSWPAYPGSIMSLWGALRAPSSFRLPGGEINLSLILCLAVGLAGCGIYIAGVQVSHSGVSFARRVRRSGSVWRGFRRVSLFVPSTIVLTVLIGIMLISDALSWGGNLQALVGVSLRNSLFIIAPLVAVAATIIGQAHWRSGARVFEQLSPRSFIARFSPPLLLAFTMALVVTGLPLAVLLVVTVGVMTSGGVSMAVIGSELLSSAASLLATFGFILIAALLGTLIGQIISRIWIAPVVLVAAIAAFLPLGGLGATNLDEAYRAHYPDPVCLTTPDAPVTVCSDPPNEPYLEMMHRAVNEAFVVAPEQDLFPRTVSVVNDAQSVEGSDRVAVGLSRSRSLLANKPPKLKTIQEDLARTATGACSLSWETSYTSAVFSPEFSTGLTADERAMLHRCLR